MSNGRKKTDAVREKWTAKRALTDFLTPSGHASSAPRGEPVPALGTEIGQELANLKSAGFWLDFFLKRKLWHPKTKRGDD